QFFLANSIGLLAATDYGVVVSYDGGFTWSNLNNGFYGITPSFLTRYKNQLLTGLNTSEIYATSDKGITWLNSNTDIYSYTNMISDSSRIYAVGLQGIIHSDDKGMSWYIDANTCSAISLAARNGLIAFYEWCYHGHFNPATNDLLVSSDAGATFATKNPPIANYLAIVSNSIVSVAGKYFVKSDDYGDNWQIDSS